MTVSPWEVVRLVCFVLLLILAWPSILHMLLVVGLAMNKS